MKLCHVLLVLLSLFLSSCFTADYRAPGGWLYQDTTINHGFSPNQELGPRSGQSCANAFLYLVSFGDAGIQAASASAGIRTIRAVDYRITNIVWPLYTRTCTIVYGD